jgi:hypothetical protein
MANNRRAQGLAILEGDGHAIRDSMLCLHVDEPVARAYFVEPALNEVKGPRFVPQ